MIDIRDFTRQNIIFLSLSSLLFLFSMEVTAQSTKEIKTANQTPVIIEYDFSADKYQNMVNHIDYGNFVLFRVKNLNRQAADTQIEITLVDFESERPEGVNNILDSLKTDGGITEEMADTISTFTQDIPTYFQQFEEQYSDIRKIHTLFYQIEFISKDPYLSKLEFLNHLAIRCEEVHSEFQVLQPICIGDSDFRNISLAMSNQIDQNFHNSYYSLIQKIENLKQADDGTLPQLDPLQERVSSLFENYQELQLLSNARNIFELIEKMKREQNYIQSSNPVQATSNLVEFEYTVKDFQDDENEDMTITFSLPVKGKDQITFSTGLSVSQLGQNINEFSVESISDSTGSISKDKFRNYTPKPAVFAHYYRTCNLSSDCGSAINLGLYAGAGIESTDLADNTYFIGLSGILGRENQVNINLGFSLKKVERLKSRFDVGETYTNDLLGDSITRSVFRPGFMFGLSYTIIKRVNRN